MRRLKDGRLQLTGVSCRRSLGKGVEGKESVYRRMVRQALGLGLMVTLVILVLSACGGEERQQESKPRPLPEDPQVLRPDEYRSEEFEPSLSFRVGEGWTNPPLETPDDLSLTWEATGGEATGGLSFANVQEVYQPTKTGTPNVVEAPKDMVGWFQQHPYLQTFKPEPVTVGGVKGEQFDVVVENPPEDDYSAICPSIVGPSSCVDLFRLSTGTVFLMGRTKGRFIVLEGVKGETVIIGFGSPAVEFDEFAYEAQRVLDSVRWRGS